jgi:hypothetical protein
MTVGLIRSDDGDGASGAPTLTPFSTDGSRETTILILSCPDGERTALKGMERLWSPAGATNGNQRQIDQPQKP